MRASAGLVAVLRHVIDDVASAIQHQSGRHEAGRRPDARADPLASVRRPVTDIPRRRSGVARGRVRLGNGNLRPRPEPLYFGTGNPNPDYYGDDRLGDNLYTCSIVALDADTGKLRWHYQFTPHDLHDWDANHVPVLANLPIGGQTRKVVMMANRNGFFYTLDRETGKLLVGKRYIDNSNWSKEIGADGRPVVIDNVGTPEKCLPDTRGGTNFQPPSYDPARRLFFVTAHETCVVWASTKPTPPIAMGKRVPSGGPAGCRTVNNTRRCARSIQPLESGAGNTGTAAIRRRSRSISPAESCPRPPAWYSPATTTGSSTPSMPPPERNCGAIRPAHRCGARRRSATCWMGANGSSSLQGSH